MKVINLYGGPGTGKSTTAAGLFSLMKLKGHKVEFASEYAKDMVWDKAYEVLNDQLFIFAQQHRKIRRLEQHGVDFVITDSPLLLSLNYAPKGYFHAFEDLVEEVYDSFNNIDVFLHRVKPYAPYGRRQSEESAKEMDETIKHIVLDYCNMFNLLEVNADDAAASNIYDWLRMESHVAL